MEGCTLTQGLFFSLISMVPLFDPHFTTSRPKSLKFSGTLLAANTSSPRGVGCLDLTYGATEEFMEQLLTSKDPYISPYVKSYIAENSAPKDPKSQVGIFERLDLKHLA